MEYEKKEMLIYQQGKTITDQFYLDDDYNVPDARSDVGKVILSEGKLKVEELKEVENYIRAAGTLAFRILYESDDIERKLCVLEGRIPFEEMIYVEEPLAGAPFLKSSNAELTVTVINSRKLSLKVLAELLVSSEGKKETELTMDVENSEKLYKKKETTQLLGLFSGGRDIYRIKEEVTLEGTKENIGTLLWTELSSRKLDTRIGTDEIELRGELLLFCLYESVDGKTEWMEQTIPYEGRLECSGAQEQMYHQIYPELTDINIEVRMDEDGEMRCFGVEAALEARMVIYTEEQVELLQDVYALTQVCLPQFKEQVMEQLLMQNHSKCKVREQLSLPELQDNILQICHSSGRIQVEHTETVEQGVLVEGVLHVSFLYVTSDDEIPFDVWQGMIPFSYVMESNETCEDMKCDFTHFIEQLSISLLGNGEIEVKAVLAFHSFFKKPVHLFNIEEITYEPIDIKEVEKRPGIIGYIVQDGDDLWELAKRYSTTMEGIMEVNQMENSDLKSGDKILIFKENMSIL